MKTTKTLLSIALFCLSFSSAFAQREMIDLSGKWNTPLGTCNLPGTTDENKLGDGKHPTDVTIQLTRLYPYTGALSYEKDIVITKEMAKKMHHTLFIERTKPSTLWVDGDSIGGICQLYAPHVYALPHLSEGKHTIRILIDNRDENIPQSVSGSHAWTDATQTNWNGILGKFCIIGTDLAHINSVNIYPDVKNHTARINVQIISDKKMSANLKFNCIGVVTKKVKLTPGINNISHTIDMGSDVKLWSEFHPDLYSITVDLNGSKCSDTKTVKFGMREFSTEGTQFTINGKKTFMRGTHDGCVFPLCAYSPTDVNEWKQLFLKAKEYGINHYRFHSYTPTEAAFEAADEVGMYLQTELPLWGTIDSTTQEQNAFLLNEARTSLAQLGNHPSFMALGLGNELWGDFAIMRQWLDEFRTLDNRHLYVYGSNNTLGWQGAHDGEDYMVTCRVGGADHYKTNTRTSFSFADEPDGGILNHVRPNTKDDFSYPVSITPRPIVAHETCQFQMYPDYDQIANYKGVLYPYNLEIFRDRLAENGLTSQAKDFTKATTRWALECYKADIEYCTRTAGFGGYQLLDIKDYPGQGSALCGILDVFMNQKSEYDKKVINVMQPIVPMIIMDKFCWTEKERLVAKVALCNYTEEDWNDEIKVTMRLGNRHVSIRSVCNVPQGETLIVDSIVEKVICPTGKPEPGTITIEAGKYFNEYNIWLYPEYTINPNANVVFCDTLDKNCLSALNAGKTVVLTPSFPSIENQSIGGLFTPDYWNYAMFKTISENNNKPVSPGSLGMMMDPKSKLFEEFPTDDHTDWQWWCVAKNSRPLILNSLPKDYRPIIQTVDNIERNHKLGILMEFKVGKGKLLICTTDLESISQFPEGRAYKNAIINYANKFNPSITITEAELRTLLYTATATRDIQGVKNITDYNEK